MSQTKTRLLAGIQYAGEAGITRDCVDAVIRLIQCRVPIADVRILTCSDAHCPLVRVSPGNDLIAIKSGFSSGYSGEGPHGFSYALALLDAHGVEIEEYDTPADVMERLDTSALSTKDLERLDDERPIRPTRWHDYILERHYDWKEKGNLWQEFYPIIPFAIIEKRIVDLAISFWEGPDDKLLTGYRRLEDIVRARTGIDEHGAKLFSQAFNGQTGKLGWEGVNDAEQVGRTQLFTGAYMAYRNRRAHCEPTHDSEESLREFLMLNQLFVLESRATERATSATTASA